MAPGAAGRADAGPLLADRLVAAPGDAQRTQEPEEGPELLIDDRHGRTHPRLGAVLEQVQLGQPILGLPQGGIGQRLAWKELDLPTLVQQPEFLEVGI